MITSFEAYNGAQFVVPFRFNHPPGGCMSRGDRPLQAGGPQGGVQREVIGSVSYRPGGQVGSVYFAASAGGAGAGMFSAGAAAAAVSAGSA